MERIDAHQHFWIFDPVRDNWIDESMSAIQKDFMPVDLEPLLKKNGFSGCVVVQSNQSEQETYFQLDNASKFDFIKGVVGWLDLQSEDIEIRLEKMTQHKKLKGFRHVLQGETDRALMLKPAFKKGISALNKYDLTYDLLILPDQLQYAAQLISEFPNQKFVIDHMAKPYIKDKYIGQWEYGMRKIGALSNAYCKVSGMVTEADWQNWQYMDFVPYLDIVFNAFGIDKLMFGSDWPVCNIAGNYQKVINIAEHYAGKLSMNEQTMFWGDNATKFYKL
ncbi:amidohydrolase family protein [Mucilaginibacter sp.]